MNTVGIGVHIYSNKRGKLFNVLKKHSSPKAILFLQETHSTEKVGNLWTSQWGCGNVAFIFHRFIFDDRGNRHKIHILALLNYFQNYRKSEVKNSVSER